MSINIYAFGTCFYQKLDLHFISSWIQLQQNACCIKQFSWKHLLVIAFILHFHLFYNSCLYPDRRDWCIPSLVIIGVSGMRSSQSSWSGPICPRDLGCVQQSLQTLQSRREADHGSRHQPGQTGEWVAARAEQGSVGRHEWAMVTFAGRTRENAAADGESFSGGTRRKMRKKYIFVGLN